MSSTDDQSLLDLTLKLKKQYEDLDRLLDNMAVGSTDSIDAINDHMTSIRDTESNLHPRRAEYRRNNTHLAPELKVPTDQTIELLRGIMPKLAQLEKATIDSSQRLFPKIQESVRAVQMQNAYQTGMRGS